MSRRTALLCVLTAAAAALPAAPAQARATPPPAPALRFGACPDTVPQPAAPD
ncbi:MAG: alpha/beta hydrolase, partial [Streptomyces sp.]|nr:alpha/beta hydrolase [Streptomyces sp.]